ncbi:hypothetical protein MHM98_15565 [Psychrobium sp. MM17-31]|uniref:hypothetical protein n=1 Tax=Psychrobium sp. MM17-31 TaxID=2917758 RepID=UPI001EF6D1BA|nr:hypothetical protein [Psychrobium sp. MM17-31]MCG7532752.1 hypothetical protein [Psychrobium sp. MM17-31]
MMKLDFETGIGEVQYGMLRREVAQIMGEPDLIENQDGKIDEFCDEQWHYNDSSLIIVFDNFYQFRVSGFKVSTSLVYLNERSLIGLKEDDIDSLAPSVKLMCQGNNASEYESKVLGLELFLKNQQVTEFWLTTDSAKLHLLCSRSFQKKFTNKRLLKKNLRCNEVSLAKSLGQFILTQNSDLFTADFSWFIGAYLGTESLTADYWCDGVEFKQIKTLTKYEVFVDGVADMMSSTDDGYNEHVEFSGIIKIKATGKGLVSYRLEATLAGEPKILKKSPYG